MMSQILAEDVVTMHEAAKAVPKRKKPHVSTMWRWAIKGLHGKKLETAKIGAVRVTSLQALNRFLDATQ